MNEDRINKIEKDLAIIGVTQTSMSQSLEKISVSLEKISNTHTEVRLLTQKLNSMDREVGEAFVRKDKRIDKVELEVKETRAIIARIAWLFIAPTVAAVIGLVLKG